MRVLLDWFLADKFICHTTRRFFRTLFLLFQTMSFVRALVSVSFMVAIFATVWGIAVVLGLFNQWIMIPLSHACHGMEPLVTIPFDLLVGPNTWLDNHVFHTFVQPEAYGPLSEAPPKLQELSRVSMDHVYYLSVNKMLVGIEEMAKETFSVERMDMYADPVVRGNFRQPWLLEQLALVGNGEEASLCHAARIDFDLNETTFGNLAYIALHGESEEARSKAGQELACLRNKVRRRAERRLEEEWKRKEQLEELEKNVDEVLQIMEELAKVPLNEKQ